MIATVKIILDKRRVKKSGLYPVKLRITYNRTREYYSCNYDMDAGEFDKLFFLPKLNKSQLKIKQSFNALENKALGVIQQMPVFTFKQFEQEFFSESDDKNDVFSLFDTIISELRKEDRIGTASAYNCAKVSLQYYSPILHFTDITPEFLKTYQKKMLENGVTLTTIGFYLRSLRRIYNIAIARKLARKDDYPFGLDSYRIPVGENVKKALSIEEIQMIFDYKVIDSSPMHKAKDFWLLTYLCSGMNMIDIAHLKFKNMSDGELHFNRQKTIRSLKNAKLVNVTLLPETISIIERWGNTQTSNNDYIFPILLPGMNEDQKKAAVANFLKIVNKYMKKIAKELKINKNITTYVARHSFATVLKRSGASTEFIQEQLAHADKSTTENYLGNFEKEERMKTTLALTNFKKNK